MTLLEAINKLANTSETGVKEAEELGIELDELEDAMSSHGYERCVSCDLWTEICELDEEYVCSSYEEQKQNS